MQSVIHHACAPTTLWATETKTLGKASSSRPRSVTSQPSTEMMIGAVPRQCWGTGDDNESEKHNEGAGHPRPQ